MLDSCSSTLQCQIRKSLKILGVVLFINQALEVLHLVSLAFRFIYAMDYSLFLMSSFERFDKMKKVFIEEVASMMDANPIEYDKLLSYLLKQKNPVHLREVVKAISRRLPVFTVMATMPRCYEGNIDYISLTIIRQSATCYRDVIPIESLPNGNCLFNSVSLLLCGDNSLTPEIKV